MPEKTKKIKFCTRKVLDMLDYLRPHNEWDVLYATPEQINIDEWRYKYLGLIKGEEYFFIYVNDEILYAVNVTGDSELTAIQELITKLAAKF